MDNGRSTDSGALVKIVRGSDPQPNTQEVRWKIMVFREEKSSVRRETGKNKNNVNHMEKYRRRMKNVSLNADFCKRVVIGPVNHRINSVTLQLISVRS